MSTWILLRGLTRETRHWGGLPDALRQAAGASRVLLIDLPGNGEFAHLRAPATVAAMVEFVRIAAAQGGEVGSEAVCAEVVGTEALGTEALGAEAVSREAVGRQALPREAAARAAAGKTAASSDAVRAGLPNTTPRAPFNVLAMSLGGMVATAWAQRHPGEVARLVLINTSMRPFSRAHERLRPSAWPGLSAIAMHWHDAMRAERVIHRLTCNNVDTLNADLESWSMIRRSAPVSRGNALRQLLAAARFTADAARPACPLLVLSSRDDRLVNPICSTKLAAAWGAPHREHAWAGHDLPHDDPAWIADQLRGWLAQEAVDIEAMREAAVARLQHQPGQRV